MPPTTRRGNMFGPYMLLQTLGEGEFAKVKLGMHAESGEEVSSRLLYSLLFFPVPLKRKLGILLFVLFEQIRVYFPYHTWRSIKYTTYNTQACKRNILHNHTNTYTHNMRPARKQRREAGKTRKRREK